MNHKKKITMLGVAFAISVIALAGVGYAVTHPGYQGTASTNIDNDYDVDYVVVKFNNNNAFVAAPAFELTWNTETNLVNSEQVVTYSWQASDTLVHGLVITATDTGTDTYVLKATVSAPASGYKLYYKESQDAGPATATTNWTEYNNNCSLVTGLSVTPGAINSDAVSQYITWVIIPEDTEIDDGTAPGTTVAIASISYVVEGAQPQS